LYYVFLIMENLASALADTAAGIHSVIGHSLFPGLIFFEASGTEVICGVIQGFSYDTSSFKALECKVAKTILEEWKTFTSRHLGWVHLMSMPYQGDTAFINHVDQSLSVELLVIPCIPTTNNRKRQAGSHPEQALFNVNMI
jgi:hypothetical protein